MDIKPMLRAAGIGASLAAMVSISGCSPQGSGPAIPWTAARMADAGPVRGPLDLTEVDPPLPMLR